MPSRATVRFAIWWLRNPAPRFSVRVLRAMGATVGDNVTIKRSLYIDNALEDEDAAGDFRHLSIGDNVYIGDGVYFDLAAPVDIGANAVIAGHVNFVTHLDVNRSMYLNKVFPRRSGRVVVGPGASVSFGATVLAGATVAEDSSLAAGALLLENTSTSPRSLWAGVPARQLRDLDHPEQQ